MKETISFLEISKCCEELWIAKAELLALKVLHIFPC